MLRQCRRQITWLPTMPGEKERSKDMDSYIRRHEHLDRAGDDEIDLASALVKGRFF
jgi:hypothetical protein